jgi:hypothetical protein
MQETEAHSQTRKNNTLNSFFIAINAKKDEPHSKKKVREIPVPSRDVTTKKKISLGGKNDVIT